MYGCGAMIGCRGCGNFGGCLSGGCSTGHHGCSGFTGNK